MAILSVIFYPKKDDNKSIIKKSYAFNIKNDGETSYTSVDTIPSDLTKYHIDEEKTTCENGGKVSIVGNKLAYQTIGSDRCTVYLYYEELHDIKINVANLSYLLGGYTKSITDCDGISGGTWDYKLNGIVIDNISRLTSYRSLTDTLNSNKLDINDKTVGTYIKYLCEAFAFYKIKRFDVQGKKYLVTQDKYYLSDHTVKFAIQGTKNMNYGCIYENIVAMKRNEKIYIQVSDNIGNDFENDTFKREVTPLLQIKDAYPKMIIARTRHDDYQYEGILIVDIANWLTRL